MMHNHNFFICFVSFLNKVIISKLSRTNNFGAMILDLENRLDLEQTNYTSYMH